jgi:hypothetical protein
LNASVAIGGACASTGIHNPILAKITKPFISLSVNRLTLAYSKVWLHEFSRDFIYTRAEEAIFAPGTLIVKHSSNRFRIAPNKQRTNNYVRTAFVI